MIFLGRAVRNVAITRKMSKGASMGSLGFLTTNFRDATYFWILITSLKDLLFVLAPALVADDAAQLLLCGMLYLTYAFLASVALPFEDNSANGIDVVLSFFVFLQMVMTAGLGSVAISAQYIFVPAAPALPCCRPWVVHGLPRCQPTQAPYSTPSAATPYRRSRSS